MRDLEPSSANKRHLRAMLIFNPASGSIDESPLQLMNIIEAMQAWKIIPEPYIVGPECNFVPVIQDALRRGIRYFVVCGGDGTIECVAGILVGTQAVLGVIPTGTRNNVALGLGIPQDILKAVALLRNGRRIKVDVGHAVTTGASCYFLETCSIGLLSALYSSSDEIQHGNLTRVGEFVATLITSPPAEIRLLLDGKDELKLNGHVILVSNFPYVGPHFQVTPEGSFQDGLLDILVFTDLSKLALLNNVVQMVGGGNDDPNIRRYLAAKVQIKTDPPMSIMADGCSLKEGPVTVGIRRRALTVMAGELSF